MSIILRRSHTGLPAFPLNENPALHWHPGDVKKHPDQVQGTMSQLRHPMAQNVQRTLQTPQSCEIAPCSQLRHACPWLSSKNTLRMDALNKQTHLRKDQGLLNSRQSRLLAACTSSEGQMCSHKTRGPRIGKGPLLHSVVQGELCRNPNIPQAL